MAAVKKDETLKMAKLRKSGATYKEISDLYSITIPAVWQRLFGAGLVDSRGVIPEEIDKEQLENLYSGERLPLEKIARHLNTQLYLVKAALKIYGIPERQIITKEGRYTALLKNLQVGDQIETKLPGKTVGQFYDAARRLDIKISLRTSNIQRITITRIEFGSKAVPRYQQVNEKQLRDLYRNENLSLEKVASSLDLSVNEVAKALKYHRIPKRPQRKLGGKIVDTLRSLAIGEQTEIFYPAKYPISNFHSIAKLNKLRVSVKSLGEGMYRIMRVKDNKKGVPLHQRIDKDRLKQLYLIEKLPNKEIASNLNCSKTTIEEALKYYKIPKRSPLGSRVNALRDLTVGEEVEITCDATHPITNLRTIACRIGIKISVKTLGDGRFRVKKIENKTRK